MSKHNVLSGILVLVVILMIAVSAFVVINYATSVLTAAVAFASTDQMAKLQACGISAPAELFKLQADIPTLVLPAIYVGFPGLMIIIAILMFVAGYYYGTEKEGHSSGRSSSSETVTTTSSPNRGRGGQYASGRRVEETRSQTNKSSDNDEN